MKLTGILNFFVHCEYKIRVLVITSAFKCENRGLRITYNMNTIRVLNTNMLKLCGKFN